MKTEMTSNSQSLDPQSWTLPLRHRLSTLVACFAILIAVACTSVEPGNSALVVRAEQTRKTSFIVVNTFLKVEKANRHALFVVSPSIKHTADSLRTNFPPSFEAFKASIDAYKKLRDPVTEQQLVESLSKVERMDRQASDQLARADEALKK